eukprot:1449698-Rhodomonas_salina.2
MSVTVPSCHGIFLGPACVPGRPLLVAPRARSIPRKYTAVESRQRSSPGHEHRAGCGWTVEEACGRSLVGHSCGGSLIQSGTATTRSWSDESEKFVVPGLVGLIRKKSAATKQSSWQ